VEVEVPLKIEKMSVDTLKEGSAFCVYSAFNEDKKQLFDFRSSDVCQIESIAARDLLKLEKLNVNLSD
jgi:hypothetical protein